MAHACSHLLLISIACGCVSLMGAPVRAQVAAPSDQNWQACTSSDPKARLDGCTAVLAVARETPARRFAALRNRAAAFRLMGEASKALADLDRAATLEPGNAAVRIDRGGVLFDLGEDERALAEYDRAMKLDPRAAGAYVGRAAVLDRNGQLRRALSDLDRAISLAPKLGHAYANRAHLLARLQDMERALADAERAVDLTADDSWAYQVRGSVHQATGDYPRAVADFDRVVALSDGSIAALLLRAGALVEARQLDRAMADYTSVLAKSPGNVAALTGRARAKHLGADSRAAIADADAALKAEPGHVGALVVRGEARLADRDASGALADFEAVLAIDDTHPRAMLGRALVRLERGETDAAIGDLERVVALPATGLDEQATASDALRRLAGLKEKIAMGVPLPTGAAVWTEPAPGGALSSPSASGIDPPVWSLEAKLAECTLQARWQDRGVVIFARVGLTGPAGGLRIALSLESPAWKPTTPAHSSFRLSIVGSGVAAVEIAVADRSSLRARAAQGGALDIGPLDFAEVRDGLARGTSISASVNGVEAAFPTGDLWVWLPPFEACARQLPR